MKYLRFIIFNLVFFSLTSMDYGKAELKKLIESYSFEKIKTLIEKHPKMFSRREYDEAIIAAAQKKDKRLYDFLENYASRPAHAKAYSILNDRDSGFNFNEISKL